MIPVPRKAYERSLNRLRDSLLTVEHFRGEYVPPNRELPHIPPGHMKLVDVLLRDTIRDFDVAIALLKDGRGYVGFAKRNYKDAPNRKRGYEIAVGRALRAAADDTVSVLWGRRLRPNGHGPDLIMAKGLHGRELGDFCRQWLEESGWPVF